MVKNDNPLASVIVPVYGIEKYLDDCVRSVISQTYHNLEIILVDDKSIDNSGEICDKWAKKDNRIKVIHKAKNAGLNMARYSGWEASSGQLIAFVDGDDVIDKKYIETLYICLKDGAADIAAIGYRFFQHDEQPVLSQNDPYQYDVLTRTDVIRHHASEQAYISGFHGNLTNVHSKMFTRSILENVQWEKSNYSIGEDDFFSLMCYAACKSVALIYAELYYYRVSPNSISRSTSLNLRYNDEKISIFTLVRNYKDLSSKLLGGDFVDETNYRTYVLYKYYINLLIFKNAWTDHEFKVLQTSITKDIDDILKIQKYKIDRKLMENIKQNGSINFLVNILNEKQHELKELYSVKDNTYADLISARTEKDLIDQELDLLKIEFNSHFGIKRSARLLTGNIKRKVKGLFLN